MFKKTMKFDDLDGNEVEQTFYFNYNKKEIGELLYFGELQQFSGKRQRVVPLEQAFAELSTETSESGLSEEENNRQAYVIFHDLLLDAYGEKAADNVRFLKDDRTREYFASHVAFVELIFEVMADTKVAGEFFEKCLPAKAVAEAKAEMQKQSGGTLSSSTLMEMSQEAERRQKDPATRIEPGVIPEDADPNVVALAQQTAQTGPVPVAPDAGEMEVKPKSEWTAQDIMDLDDVAFGKLDVQGLSQEAMVAAFRRKSG